MGYIALNLWMKELLNMSNRKIIITKEAENDIISIENYTTNLVIFKYPEYFYLIYPDIIPEYFCRAI